MQGPATPDAPQPGHEDQTATPSRETPATPPNRLRALWERVKQRVSKRNAASAGEQADKGQHHDALRTLADQPEELSGERPHDQADQLDETREADQETPIRVGHINVVLDFPPDGTEPQEAAQSAVRNFTERTRTPQLQPVEMSAERRAQMQEVFELGRQQLERQARELGIDFDPQNFPDFANVDFVQAPPGQTGGGAYEYMAGRIHVFVSPTDTPLSIALHMLHELRHASSTNTLQAVWDAFDRTSTDPSLYYWVNGIAQVNFADREGKLEVRGRSGVFLDNAMALDFESRVYPELERIFPAEVAERRRLLDRDDGILAKVIDIASYTHLSVDEVSHLAEPFIERNTEGAPIVDYALMSLLILRAYYRRAEAQGIDLRRGLEAESLGPASTTSSVSVLMDRVAGNEGWELLRLTDREPSSVLALHLAYAERLLEPPKQ